REMASATDPCDASVARETTEIDVQLRGDAGHGVEIFVDESSRPIQSSRRGTGAGGDAQRVAVAAAVLDRGQPYGRLDTEIAQEPLGLDHEVQLRAEQCVVDELDALTVADGTDGDDRLGVRREHR